jgi:hypothetical protein
VGNRFFSFPEHVDWLLGPPQSPIQWIPGALSLGVKQLRNYIDNTRPSSAKVKMNGAYLHYPIFLNCVHNDNYHYHYSVYKVIN